jgi:hypothetical protein
MGEQGEIDEAFDWEPESGVYCGATTLEAERALREKYPISWPHLLEFQVREMQRLLGEVQALTAEATQGDSYQLQRKVNAMRKIVVDVDGGLLEFSHELMRSGSCA